MLLDLTMPEMSGEEALAEICRIRSDAKVIVASGYAEEDLKKVLAAKGASGFIHKPFKVGDLVASVGLVFEG